MISTLDTQDNMMDSRSFLKDQGYYLNLHVIDNCILSDKISN